MTPPEDEKFRDCIVATAIFALLGLGIALGGLALPAVAPTLKAVVLATAAFFETIAFIFLVLANKQKRKNDSRRGPA